MKISGILSRLQDLCPALQAVLPAQALNALTDIYVQTPAVYVHIAEEIPSASTLDSYTSQRTEIRISVIVVGESYDEDTGGELWDDARAEVIAALLGWAPGAAYEPLQHVSGTMIQISNSLIWWRDLWATAVLRRQV